MNSNFPRQGEWTTIPELNPSGHFIAQAVGFILRNLYFLVLCSATDDKIAREPWRKKRTFRCHMCDAMFPWFKDMQKHVREEHYAKDPNMCDVCGKSFVTRFVLKNHKKLHAPVRPFPCSVCPKSYKTNGELKSHFR